MRSVFVLIMGVGCTGEPTDPTEGTGPCTGEGTGALVIEVDAPDGTWLQEPAVLVTAPDGEVTVVSATTTLPDVAGGTYTIEVLRGETVATGRVVGDRFTATQPLAQVCVGNGGTTTFAAAWTKASGHVWISSGETLAAFSGEQVEAGGLQSPVLALQDVPFVNDFRGFAFDRTGFLFAAASPTYGSRLLWWSPDRVEARVEAGEALPDGEILSPTFGDFAPISDIVFDQKGTLWVAVRDAGGGGFTGVVGFTRETLVEVLLGGAEADIAPDMVRTIDGYEGRVDLEIAATGLWITDFVSDRLLRIDDPSAGDGVDAIFTVSAEPTTVGGTPTPLTGPENIAFDDDGNAVVLFWTSGSVVALPGPLSGAGANLVVPADPLYVDQLPTGLVVDGSGQAWIGNTAGNGTGQLLSWSAGGSPERGLWSAEVPDPADVVLDPRPR